MFGFIDTNRHRPTHCHLIEKKRLRIINSSFVLVFIKNAFWLLSIIGIITAFFDAHEKNDGFVWCQQSRGAYKSKKNPIQIACVLTARPNPIHLSEWPSVQMEKVNYQFLPGDEAFPIMFQLIIQFNVNHCWEWKKCLSSTFFSPFHSLSLARCLCGWRNVSIGFFVSMKWNRNILWWHQQAFIMGMHWFETKV